tara:strand:- start:455 stop:835 length:381 start_codon:yes stop_codon:yes gene_type:complete
MKCEFLQPEEFSDHRGVIKSFYPDEAVVEYNLMTINKGSSRGFHYHPHFNEYMMVVHGECIFTEFSDGNNVSHILKTGDSIKIPIGVAHSFEATTDMKFVSMLTKRWWDSMPPIVKVDENGNEITA